MIDVYALRHAWLHYARMGGDRRPTNEILAEFDAWARERDLYDEPSS